MLDPNTDPLHVVQCDNADEPVAVVVDCDLAAKRINLCDPCGRTSCGCNPCRHHDGPMCQRTSACRSLEVSNDEEFFLVLCRSECTSPDLSAEFYIKPKCGDVVKIEATIVDDCVMAKVKAGSLSTGWYDVQVKLVRCDGQRWTSDIRRFRIADSLTAPETEIIEC